MTLATVHAQLYNFSHSYAAHLILPYNMLIAMRLLRAPCLITSAAIVPLIKRAAIVLTVSPAQVFGSLLNDSAVQISSPGIMFNDVINAEWCESTTFEHNSYIPTRTTTDITFSAFDELQSLRQIREHNDYHMWSFTHQLKTCTSQ